MTPHCETHHHPRSGTPGDDNPLNHDPRSGASPRHPRSRNSTPSHSHQRDRDSSHSRSRTDRNHPRQQHRNWEDIPDYPDYDETVDFDYPSDLDTPTPGTRIAEVTSETHTLLKDKCSMRAKNDKRLKSRNTYSLPKVEATKTPKLDGFMRPEISSQAKTFDCQIQRLQSFVLDAVAPLTSIVEANAKGETVSHKQAVNTATAAIELVGNASTQMSHFRRTRIITGMNKTLLPLLDEDKNFKEAAPFLFGPEFAQKFKDLIDQVKAMRSSVRDPKPSAQFFRTFPPNGRGGGYNPRQGRGQNPRRGNYSGPPGRSTHQQKPQWHK